MPSPASRPLRLALLAANASALLGSLEAAQPAPSSAPVTLPAVVVHDRATSLVGTAITASEGYIGAADLARRPFLRRAELLESVPGLVATQHSGGGKANQYFLRGFNLDHGTDLALSAEGVPVNLPTHGHGQGYADVNFIIPELVEAIAFNKGPFFAAVGDFSAAGAADVRFVRSLPASSLALSAGPDGYRRGFAAGTLRAGAGQVIAAAEFATSDGPFELPENFRRRNAFLRYHEAGHGTALTITGLSYAAKWQATDQIPRRAVEDGRLGRFGHVNPDNGGDTRRHSLTLNGRTATPSGETEFNAGFVDYRLQLFSDFTYGLDDPVRGDQFEQVDRRQVYTASLLHQWNPRNGREHAWTAGVQARVDDIDNVGLHRTEQRRRFGTVRADEVRQSSLGAFVTHDARWTPKLRTSTGLRADAYRFDVASDLPGNSGRADDGIVSPKLSLVLGPWKRTEAYASFGYGFHSNDARGTVVRTDPVSGDPASPVDPLVRSRGAEIGVRSELAAGLTTSFTIFTLETDSELVFVGDAGNTEPSGAARRVGLEWINHYRVSPHVVFDLDVAVTRPRFRDAPGADRIPGAPERVVSAGVVLGEWQGWHGALRVRHQGPRPLVEDGSVRARSSTLVNTRLGWTGERWSVSVDMLNAFDRADDDIAYYYRSRLPGEPAEGIEDVHFHPVEPRTWRVTLSRSF